MIILAAGKRSCAAINYHQFWGYQNEALCSNVSSEKPIKKSH
jgi:hypothetical protein